ncbi:hypothetical protein DRJ22_05900 [Candidatus Woesearchaeota archaeon]|nr:MAG: hypothetical protein B6U93_03265 [Candidatus Woesearchaeota archaeon ex4484_78]RLE44486.1 MAG: hypothetical protein DRJ22_05900 [Candidatus Woesearchaeota archaeon]
MGLFKKKKKKLELPLPPAPAEGPTLPSGFSDIGEIRSKNFELPELPPLPELPSFKAEKKEGPTLPESPKPELPALKPLKPELQAPAQGEKEVFEKVEPVPRRFEPKAFIAVDDYRKVLDNCSVIREKLLAADNYIKKLEELKLEEDRFLDKWRSYLEKVEKKISFVDKIIAKAGEKK